MVRGCAKRLLAHLGSPGQRAIKRLLCVCVLIPLLVQENLWDWLTELRFYIPFDVKKVILETFPKPMYWLGIEKLNLTQQKHTFTNQKKCTTEMQKKTKARFSHLLWHLAWKRRGPILVSALHKSVTYLLTHLLTVQGPTRVFPSSDSSTCSGKIFGDKGLDVLPVIQPTVL